MKGFNTCRPSLNEHCNLMVNTLFCLMEVLGLNLEPEMTTLTVFFISCTYLI